MHPPPVTREELDAAAALVRRHMGFAQLRAGQAETIARVLRGEDVLAVLPTGGGKSICYQLPAVLSPRVTVVVSPLIALMKDQLDSLPGPMRAAAESLTSELAPQQARRLLGEIAAGRYRLLYVAPERLRQRSLLHALRTAGVKRLVVDEAHCVSVRGHDFRPDYLALGDARAKLGDPPILAVTATAPPRVLDDIESRLGEMARVVVSVERPNLRFEAILCKDADDKLAHLEKLCKETPHPGIVYANSRAKVEQLAEALRRRGVLADAYHAGLPDRTLRQEDFMSGKTDVLVATVAFGMGVDKQDIRFVIHHDPPSSMESYYQEAGRAGRDGEPARCVLLATPQDGGLLKQRAKRDLPSKDLLQRAWALVLSTAADDGYALIDPDAVKALSPGDNVAPNVALSFLVECGALERLGEVARFLNVDGRERSLVDVAQELGVPLEDAEDELFVRGKPFHATARAWLYRVTGAPEQVEAVLERHVELAQARVDTMMSYVRTGRCRHAALREHFGESAPTRCAACDNCLGIRHEAAAQADDDDDAARAVLEALGSVRGIGETNLVWLLRGDARTSDWFRENPSYGALSFRSESKVKAAIRAVEAAGLIARETLEHGGVTLKLNDEGRAAAAEGRLPPSAGHVRAAAAPHVTRAPAGQVTGAGAGQVSSAGAPPDPAFEALRAWRRRVADEDGVPPYVVAHDSVLRAIAEARPRTLDELRAIKGMGPKKLESYGAAILEVISTL